ncbi:MAG: hypothetical protein C4334_04235 [Pyrinomonas sp.]|uniref:cytochrome C assembly family protein n=1 Tax=Pyrinomonas sp. TaxID=2080306 RepID=UPI00331B42F5
MKTLLLVALAAYIVAAIHAVLGFINRRRALERVAHASLAAGFSVHTAALAVDWFRDRVYPLFHRSETLSFLGWALVLFYVFVFRRYRTHALGSFMLPLVALLVLAASLMQADGRAMPQLLATGEAAWLFPIHTTSLFLAYAAFFVVFIASVMYLLQERELKLKHFGMIFHRLPSLATVDEISAVATSIGFTCLTLGIIAGMSWSFARDGRAWRNDPKEVLTALTWLLYLLLLSQRYVAGWRGRRAAWIGLAGFTLVLCTFFGARLMGGYHVFG